ncbi:hypothetical protein CEXT_631901 [Caerostris extrusa]|uniref:Uncharacterized protein n=1 Tax=Caerostris extrusa TaxID=172846 RepID=A0AAV4TBS6_CAEEX|nr:hypothetical protein CEXT_631901 [Caerostris extrusa]
MDIQLTTIKGTLFPPSRIPLYESAREACQRNGLKSLMLVSFSDGDYVHTRLAEAVVTVRMSTKAESLHQAFSFQHISNPFCFAFFTLQGIGSPHRRFI